MKKKILFASLASFLLLTQTACDDNKEEYLSDFSTILYFKNSGEIPLTLYKTGENTDYKLVVDKAGYQSGTVTEVNVSVMDDASLAVYNAEQGTSYKALPTSCYELASDSKLSFGAADMYKQFNIVLKTNTISDLLNEESGVEYVVPMQLTNSKDSINSEKNVAMVKPSVFVPSVYFSQTGYVQNFFSDSGDKQMKFTLPVEMPLASRWSFDCTIEVDKSLLDAYNEANDCDYSLLPASAYQMPDKVSFTANGNTTEDLNITVDRSGLTYGNYVLPVSLADCTKEEFVIDQTKNSCLYGVSYVPDISKLSATPLTVDMLSSNSPAAEGSLDAMLDGDVNTYFHSDYSGAVAPPHYLQVDLKEAKTALSFSFTARSSQGNGTPAQMEIYGSMDGNTFSKIGVLSEGFPPAGADGAGKSYTSPVMVGKEFKCLRLYIMKNQAGADYFVFSEFGLKTL